MSVALDPPEAWVAETEGMAISTPLLSDADNRVANRYGVMRWQMLSSEPGHTFFLIGEDGAVLWIRDYGAPENGGLMYVAPGQLLPEIASRLTP